VLRSPERAAAERGLSLLADWLEHGPRPDILNAWAAVPDAPVGHAQALPEAHTRLSILELPPVESGFLSADGLHGGEVAEAVAGLWTSAGFEAPTSPDALPHQLRLLAFLLGAEAAARHDGVNVEPIVRLRAELVGEHLLRWVPAWRGALQTTPDVPALFDYAADLVVAALVAFAPGATAAWALPPLDAVLDRPRAGLREVGQHLASPPQAGGFFTRSALVGIGRRLDLPSGFGSRAEQIETLLRSAAGANEVPALVGCFGAILDRWDRVWVEVGEAGHPHAAAPWRNRIGASRQLLQRLVEGAGSAAAPG
jgi:hypothetical protein